MKRMPIVGKDYHSGENVVGYLGALDSGQQGGVVWSAKQHSDEASRSGGFPTEWTIGTPDPAKSSRRERFPTEWTIDHGDEVDNEVQMEQSEDA